MARSAKSLTFRGERSQSDLHDALLLLRILGHWDIVLPIVSRIANMPFLQQWLFQLPRGIVHEARWYAHRIGRDDIARELAAHVFDPPGFVPVDLEDDSNVFFRPLDDTRRRISLGLDPNEDPRTYVLPPGQRPGFFLRDLYYLSMIWAYGGSPVWPLDRLEHERARREEGLLALPGMS